MRGGSHSGNVAASELARAGCIDILSSDYVPGSLLHGAFLLHQQAGWPLPQALACVTANPARALGLHEGGEIAVGRRADLLCVRWDGELPWIRAVWIGGVRVS